jgi:hypothetical protein
VFAVALSVAVIFVFGHNKTIAKWNEYRWAQPESSVINVTHFFANKWRKTGPMLYQSSESSGLFFINDNYPLIRSAYITKQLIYDEMGT